MGGKYHIFKESKSEGGLLTIDPSANICVDVKLDRSADLTIGANVTISRDVHIYTHDHFFNRPRWDLLDIKIKPKRIGVGVFIGVNTIITMNCTTIGDYAFIGPNSVVTKSVPAYEMWGGNPAHKFGDVIHEH
jgi:maltose O-acetyltransferase